MHKVGKNDRKIELRGGGKKLMVYLTTLVRKWFDEWFNVIAVCSLLMYDRNQQVRTAAANN